MKKDGDLRNIFRRKIPEFHWQSIESPLTGQGTPDANFCHDGVEGWIEFKKTSGNKIASMKPEQVAWAERRMRAGGRVFLVVRQETKKLDRLWIANARMIRVIFMDGLPASISMGSNGAFAMPYDDGPLAWDWESVRKLLLS